MSGVRRCKEFLKGLSQEEMRNIRVKIKRPNIPEPENSIIRIYRGLDDPKNLIIHFKKESLRGIFDREDIVVNQEFPEETKNKNSRNCDRSSSVEDDRRDEKSRNVSYYQESSTRHERRSFRSRSRSGDRSRRERSRSGSYRRRSRSPAGREKSHRHRYSLERRRSRSFSPQPKKKPGLFIPTEKDYLKYEKRKANRSRSPVASHSGKKMDEHSTRSSVERRRSPWRRSRTPSRGRRSRSGSPRKRKSRRSRSRSRHHEREIEEVGPFGNPKMAPCIFQDGKYWIPVGPAFIPRGYIPPPMYPRPFLPPMMMPRMSNMMMQPYRPRIQRPKLQSSSYDVPSTSSTVQIAEVSNNEENKAQNSEN